LVQSHQLKLSGAKSILFAPFFVLGDEKEK